MTTSARIACGCMLLCFSAGGAARAADAPPERLTMAVPGVPPVFSGLVAFVARDQGFFKKHGVDVEVRPFDSGVATAQAVVAGGVDFSLSPTAAIVRMVSNGNVDLVGIWGMEHADWLLGSTEPGRAKCDLKGQSVGVDSVGGARAVALGEFLRPCGLKVEDVKLVSLSSNVGAAMIGGQIKLGILHIDDIPVIEEQTGKPVTVLATYRDVDTLTHYNLVVVKRDRLKQRRDAYVRALAAIVEAVRFANDPRNAARMAQIATVTGRTAKLAGKILPRLEKIEFWPAKTDGLSRANIESVVKTEKQLGGIRPGKEPVSYDRLVDGSVWKDASALLE
ncbi:MAG TPA: ABC transporter substrate-binding protein [Myxococcales bacterium]